VTQFVHNKLYKLIKNYKTEEIHFDKQACKTGGPSKNFNYATNQLFDFLPII
jgi:hypothetical protein